MRRTFIFISAVFASAFALESCASECGCGINETDFATDSAADTTDPDTGEAHGSFCNPLTLGTESVRMNLLIGTGASQVTLSASTGTCSNPLGEACAPIPHGTAVPLTVQTEDGQILYTTALDMAPGANYVFFTSVDSNAAVILMSGLLTEALDCAQMECIRSAYNERTCAEADPCGWANNGTCDAYCADVLADGQPMFDDGVDCAAAR